MNCTKNPLFKEKARVEAMDKILTVAGIHFARLLYVLKDEGFGERKPECVPAPEGPAQTDCDRCIQAWLDEEVET